MMLRALLLLAPLSSLAFQLHCGISSNLPRNGQLTQLTSARLGSISSQYRSRMAFRTTPRMVDASVEESKQFWLELVNQKMAQKEEERKAAAAKDTEIIQPAGDCYNAEEAKTIVSNARAKLDAQFQEIDARTQRTLRRVVSHPCRSATRSLESWRYHQLAHTNRRHAACAARNRCWTHSGVTGWVRTSSAGRTATATATTAATRSTKYTPSSSAQSRHPPHHPLPHATHAQAHAR